MSEAERAMPMPGHEPLVLVVDDQEANLQLLGTVLTQAGYEVIPALNAEQAIARIDGEEPDLALLDLMMPGVDGLELAKRLHAREGTEELPMIMLTASHEREQMIRAFDAGFVDFVTKPFVAKELLARVRTHVELKRSRDRLARVARERRDLLSLVAHDLKNPFSSIRFSADLLRECRDDEQRRQLTQLIERAAAEGLELIQRNLESQADAELQRGFTPQACRVDEAVAWLLQRFEVQAAAKEIRVGHELAPDLVVQADLGALQGVLSNLLSNALKYSPSGRAVEIVAARAGPQVRIAVRDRGPGIGEADRQDLFRRFVRLGNKPTAGESSTGIGLALAKQDARQMGGDLWFEPRNGGGSVFVLELPAASE